MEKAMSTLWVVAPFESEVPHIWQQVWEANLRDGYISVGWRKLGNVSRLKAPQILERHRKSWPEAKVRGAMADAKILFKFWHSIHIEDRIVARRGRKSIAAIGTVQSDPYYNAAKAKNAFAPWEAYPNHIDVLWDAEPRDVMFPKQVFGIQR